MREIGAGLIGILAVFIATGLCEAVTGGDATVSPARISAPLNKSFTVTVTLQSPAADDLSVVSVTPPESANLMLENAHQRSRSYVENGIVMNERVFYYTYHGMATGKTELSPCVIEAGGDDKTTRLIKSNAVPVIIVSTWHHRAMILLYCMGGAVAVLVIGAGIAFIKQHRKKQRAAALRAAATIEEKQRADAIAQQLQTLKHHFVAGNDSLYFKEVRQLLAGQPRSGEAGDLIAEIDRCLEDIQFGGVMLEADKKNILVRKIERYIQSQIQNTDEL